jgi:polysaccharide pyruvyl transferase WcaK-like protein
MDRRDFLQTAMTLAAASVIAPYAWAQSKRRPRILLRSSWQVVNIGDIAHTPGVLAMIERHFPEAEVRLWASGDLTPEVAAMEHRRFPSLKIVKGSIKDDGSATTPELQDAIGWADFLLHGSGPSLVAAKDVTAWDKHIGKPFGIFGITYGGGTANQIALMSRAKFAYFRDSVSLQKAKDDGIQSPVMEFGPDGAFACDLRDDAAATKFLQANQLTDGKFVCCIPRLRYTPYWLIKKREVDPTKAARNAEMAEHDHAPLREAITAVVRETDHKVLLCPEDMTHMAVGKEHIFDKLPENVRSRVVWREKYWLTDEALSVYTRSAGMFGLEMHSPIMCIGNGIPALVGRFSEQTSKGFMWRDIGLDKWLFDFDQPEQVNRLTPTVLSMLQNRQETLATVQQAKEFVAQRQKAMVQRLQASVPAV